MKRKTLQKFVDWLLNTLTKLEYSGLENIPEKGGVLITTNHLSRFDIPTLFALKSGVPIVPVGISGTDTAVKQLLSFRRPTFHLRFGPAYTLPPIGRENREEVLKQYTDEIMCRIAALLPRKYHGFYANHPRLKEFQAITGAITE